MPSGGVKKYRTKDALESAIAEYFDGQDAKERPYTMMGLCVVLDISRQTLLNYSRNAEYGPVITAARRRVQTQVEERMMSGDTPPGAAIFWMKNNAGYVDKQEVKNDTTMKIQPVQFVPANNDD